MNYIILSKEILLLILKCLSFAETPLFLIAESELGYNLFIYEKFRYLFACIHQCEMGIRLVSRCAIEKRLG